MYDDHLIGRIYHPRYRKALRKHLLQTNYRQWQPMGAVLTLRVFRGLFPGVPLSRTSVLRALDGMMRR